MHFIIDGKPAASDELLRIKDEYIRRGIFSVDDMGHKSGIGLEAKKVLVAKLSVRSAGYAVCKKGGYGAFLGRAVSGTEEIKEAVREIAGAGADFLKVINSGIVSTKGAGLVTEGGFSADELKIIREEGGERNLKMVCHANSDEAVRNALDAGASSIEHGYFVSHETLHEMAEKKALWIPTVFALSNICSVCSVGEKRNIEEVIERHLLSINYAASIGVALRVGTDSGSKGIKHGESFFAELQLFQRAGLSLEQILSAACMSWEEIDKGNFLVVKKDFITTRKIEAILKDGNRL